MSWGFAWAGEKAAVQRRLREWFAETPNPDADRRRAYLLAEIEAMPGRGVHVVASGPEAHEGHGVQLSVRPLEMVE